jgi:hypothetical protein
MGHECRGSALTRWYMAAQYGSDEATHSSLPAASQNAVPNAGANAVLSRSRPKPTSSAPPMSPAVGLSRPFDGNAS